MAIHLLRGSVVKEREGIPAQSGGGGLGDVERGSDRHRGIRGIAARGEDLQPGGDCQRLGCSHHAAGGVDRGAVGGEGEIGHGHNIEINIS